ncbi:VOC family protein [Sphingomonas sp.]|uniref:VOC family protein n=1 Tax=Sphingomonas sp. TaxID=28214 RepID=UPI002ED82441
MIHHASVGSSDLARSRIFYQAVIPVLGYRLVSEDDQSLDYGSGVFAFSVERPLDGKPATGGNGTHIAFEARRRADVDAFYREGLAHGGRDGGPPDCARNMTPITMAPFCSTPTATRSRR